MSECIKITHESIYVGQNFLPYDNAISLLSSFTHMEFYKVYKPTAAFFQKSEFDAFYTPVFEETLLFFLINFLDVPNRADAKEILAASVSTSTYEKIYADVLLKTIAKISDCGGICN